MGRGRNLLGRNGGTERTLLGAVDDGALVVVCAGMPRSSSTWMFNAARLVLGRAHGSVESGWIDDLARDGELIGGASCVLVKTHVFDAALAARAGVVLCTHRDLVSTAASMLRMGFVRDESGVVVAIGDAIGDAEAWEACAGLTVPHEEISRDPADVVGRVAWALGVGLDAQACGEIARAVPADGPRGGADGGSGYDPVTLLHRGHVRGAGEATPALSDACVRELETRFGQWSTRHGYRGGA